MERVTSTLILRLAKHQQQLSVFGANTEHCCPSSSVLLSVAESEDGIYGVSAIAYNSHDL